jgi:hypothetical protein
MVKVSDGVHHDALRTFFMGDGSFTLLMFMSSDHMLMVISV